MEPRVEIKEHMRGGKGHVIMKHQMGSAVFMRKSLWSRAVRSATTSITTKAKPIILFPVRACITTMELTALSVPEILPLRPTASVTAWTTPEPKTWY